MCEYCDLALKTPIISAFVFGQYHLTFANPNTFYIGKVGYNGINYADTSFAFNYCPMCGRDLRKEVNK